MEAMTEFEYEGKRYLFDAAACHRGLGMVELPDGTVLKVVAWSDSEPKRPLGFWRANILPILVKAKEVP